MPMSMSMSMSMSSKRSKWASTAASIWIQCTAGGSYCFGIYSPLLKSSQSYTQTTLNSVSFFKDVGANVGVLSGLLYSYISQSSPSVDHPERHQRWRLWKRGPWVVIATGAVQCFVGYFMMWLSVTGMVSRPPVASMCLYMFLAAHAQTFFNTADVVTAVENFPGNRGTAVGIMKGFLGLSGAMLIEAYHTIPAGDPSSFILLLALLPTFLPLLLMCLVNVHHHGRRGDDDTRHLNGFSALSLLVAAYLMGLIIWENAVPIEAVVRVITSVILLLLLVSPVWFVFTSDRSMESTTMAAALMGYHHNPSEERDGEGDLNLLQAMRRVDFWLLFISMACGMGSGLATVNNMSQIGGSLNYTTVEISTLVSLWSIWNFLGRSAAGRISDHFLKTRGRARPMFISATLAAMSIGHVTIASAFPGALYVGSVVVGVCYGSQWSLMPTITSELFGVAHMGTIFNTISIASPLGSYVLSVKVIGYLFDMAEEEEEEGSHACTGAHCFRLSFLIMAVVALLGAGVALVLFFRTRQFYRQVIVKNLCQPLG